jgi:hypothetical protein
LLILGTRSLLRNQEDMSWACFIVSAVSAPVGRKYFVYDGLFISLCYLCMLGKKLKPSGMAHD